MMLESTANIGGEEIIEDDDRDRVEDDGYSMAEVFDGADFEYIYLPITVSRVQNRTHILYLFTTVWDCSTVQPNTP